MSFPFHLDRVMRAVCEAPAREEARRRAGAAWSAQHGVNLLRLLDGRVRPRVVRAAAALLVALELGRPWDAATRTRLEQVIEALESMLTAASEANAGRAATLLHGLRRLTDLDDVAREAAADAALARMRTDPAPQPIRRPAEPAG